MSMSSVMLSDRSARVSPGRLTAPKIRRDEKAQRIEQMLLRVKDARDSERLGGNRDGYDSFLLLFPPSWNAAFRELDRCLSKMRSLGSQQAVNGEPLRIVYFHTLAWYVDVHWRQAPIYTRRLVKTPGKGPGARWVKQLTGYRLEPRRHRDAREQKARLGVEWLAREYAWDRVHLRDIRVACGEVSG